jgi:hypothetical protein
MSKTFFSLEIDTKPENFEKIDTILKVSRDLSKNYWIYGIVHADAPLEITESTVISHFLNILEGNYSQLLSLGITSTNITIWMVYEYDDQCNMEFHSEDTKRLGDNGITLCVSCYQS